MPDILEQLEKERGTPINPEDRKLIVLYDPKTGAFDGLYSSMECVREVQDYLNEKWIGSAWQIREVSNFTVPRGRYHTDEPMASHLAATYENAFLQHLKGK
tara:strand:+ start:3723 stop:4025 length:303 start_codon:yes stop_codon:yes gene_type:complete